MYPMQILASAFLAILFLQSGIDKLVDRSGNLEWLKGHFAKSPLAGIVPALLTAITIVETAAGALSAIGCVVIISLRSTARLFRPLRLLRSSSDNGWQKITLARRFLFRTFCSR
jgi:hypothetical protein